MHESRMMAVVCPSGVWAIEKVSGSRMATPFAPPRPGSTPMMTPRIPPMHTNSRLCQGSATAQPWNSDSSSCTRPPSVQAEPGLDRALGQRHEEPALEDEEEHHAVAHGDEGELPPGVLAEPAHEEGDEDGARHVQAEPADQRDVDRRG